MNIFEIFSTPILCVPVASPEPTPTHDWITIFTGALAVVAIFQFVAMWRQAKYMRDGLKSSQQTAEAALLNAKAIINAERAWISITPHLSEIKFYPLREKNAPIPENIVDALPIAHVFPAKMVNVGKTPAKIEGSAIHYVRSTIHPSEWNAIPDYGVLSEYVHVAFPSEVLTLTAELFPLTTLTEAQINAIETQKEFLYAYGIVKYSDVYGNKHETRFGYIYQPQISHLVMKDGVIETLWTGEARFRIGGPPAYNGHPEDKSPNPN